MMRRAGFETQVPNRTNDLAAPRDFPVATGGTAETTTDADRQLELGRTGSCRHDFGRRPRGHAPGRGRRLARRAAADRAAGARRIAARRLGRAGRGRGDHAAGAVAPAAAQPLLRRPQLPRPRRRARRQRLSRQPAGRGRLADRLRQARRMRDRPARPGAPAGRGDQQPDRLRERARGRDRPRRPRHPAGAGDGPRLRLHHRQRRQRPRRAGPAPAVGPRQELRHLLPDGAVDHHRRRDGRPRHPGARLGQRRAAPGRPHPGHDLRHPDADRDLLARHHAAIPATSSPPARRRAWAWASSRRSGWPPATW